MFKLMDFEDLEETVSILKSQDDFDYDEKENHLTTNMYSIYFDNKKVGFFGLESRQNSLCFCYFYIYEQYRNKGYAKRTLEELINQYKRTYGYIYGFVSEDNKRAIDLYTHYMFLGKDHSSICKLGNFEKQKQFISYSEDVKGYEVVFYFNQELFNKNQESFKKERSKME